jgi:hypothetical protein
MFNPLWLRIVFREKQQSKEGNGWTGLSKESARKYGKIHC